MWRRLETLAKLVANASAAALVFPLLIAALLLVLNPEAAPGPADLAGGWLVLLAAYGAPLWIGLPLGFAVVRFFAARPLSLGWLHLKAAVWFLVAAAGGAIVVYALNLAVLGDLLGPRGRARLTAALAIVAAAWLAAAALAGAAQRRGASRPAAKRRAALGLLVAAGPLALLAGAARRTGGAAAPASLPEFHPRGGPVVLLGVEGATFSEILPLVAEGRLPNLARLLGEGAHGALRTVRPCRESPAWAALSTGMLPSKNGLRGGRVYTLRGMGAPLDVLPAGLLMRTWLPASWIDARPADTADLDARPLWSILDALDVPASFVSWPLANGAGGEPGAGADLAKEDAEAVEWTVRLLAPGGKEPAAGGPAGKPERRLLQSVAADLRSHHALMRILSTSRPRLAAALLPGLGGVGAAFARYRGGEGGASAREEEVERYGRVPARYHEFVDHLVGEARASMPPDGRFVVVSAYGTEPTAAARRFLRRVLGQPRPWAGHDGGPAGVLLIAGPGVAAGRRVEELRTTDVVPLVLYLLGAPVGRDMDGRLPRRLFERWYLERNPITFIPSYG